MEQTGKRGCRLDGKGGRYRRRGERDEGTTKKHPALLEQRTEQGKGVSAGLIAINTLEESRITHAHRAPQDECAFRDPHNHAYESVSL